MDKQQEVNLLTDIFANSEKIQRAMGRAVRQALIEHKQAGNPVAIWEDDKAVLVPPEEIVIPPEPEEESGENPA